MPPAAAIIPIGIEMIRREPDGAGGARVDNECAAAICIDGTAECLGIAGIARLALKNRTRHRERHNRCSVAAVLRRYQRRPTAIKSAPLGRGGRTDPECNYGNWCCQRTHCRTLSLTSLSVNPVHGRDLDDRI